MSTEPCPVGLERDQALWWWGTGMMLGLMPGEGGAVEVPHTWECRECMTFPTLCSLKAVQLMTEL